MVPCPSVRPPIGLSVPEAAQAACSSKAVQRRAMRIVGCVWLVGNATDVGSISIRNW